MRQALAGIPARPHRYLVGFLLLAGGTFVLDQSSTAWVVPIRTLLQTYAFADATATGDLLGTIALIRITSITVSLLLVALQQSASAMTHQMYDQFLRNRRNQVYFGFFVGLSVYALITLASVGSLNPVFGGTVALMSTIMALCLLLVLFYTTVNQIARCRRRVHFPLCVTLIPQNPRDYGGWGDRRSLQNSE